MSDTRWYLQFVWIAIIVVAWTRVIDWIPNVTVYKGSTVESTVYSGEGIQIQGKGSGSTLQAASGGHFIFDSGTGRVIESRFVKSPLGWRGEYHVAQEAHGYMWFDKL